jgi:hypothetical protein
MEGNKEGFGDPLPGIDLLIIEDLIDPSEIFSEDDVLVNEDTSIFDEYLKYNYLLDYRIIVFYDLWLGFRVVARV